MAVKDSKLTDEYAIYNGDSCEVLADMADKSIHFSIYSLPFKGLYHYSSDPRDLSNCADDEQFFAHYELIVDHIRRMTIPGRLTAVHCMDVPRNDHLQDFPGDIVDLHEKLGWKYVGRHAVWKEPLGVRNRTMARGLAHKQIVDDSAYCDMASADYLLLFRNAGKNTIPVSHPNGLLRYAGERQMPADLMRYKGWTGNQIENKYSHWIWRNYASSFWDDVRIDRVLPYKESREPDDEKHVHPLQLDVIERCVILRTNPGETVLTPFMGVGSEVYGAVINGRRGIGVELKAAYYKQAVANMALAKHANDEEPSFEFEKSEDDPAEDGE